MSKVIEFTEHEHYYFGAVYPSREQMHPEAEIVGMSAPKFQYPDKKEAHKFLMVHLLPFTFD